jgi:hypothetical protein
MTILASLAMRLMGRRDEASCAEVAAQLQAYLDGHTETQRVQRIERHLERCRRCGLEARTYREIKSALARRGSPVDPAAVRRLTAFGETLTVGDAEQLPGSHGPGSAQR